MASNPKGHRPVRPPLKPMAAARRVSLFERMVQTSLSSAAAEILFERASHLSEGQLDGDGFFGSTMITVDCGRIAYMFSDACDAATVRQVSQLCARDQRVRTRARAIGVAEAERLAGATLQNAQVDINARASGTHLHIDVDVEAHSRVRKPRQAGNAQ